MAADTGWHRKRITPAVKARAREYNTPKHRALRKAWQVEVDAGHASCWRCGKPIPPGTKWQLGHDDNDRTVYRGPEHPRCNLSAAARKGARIRNAQGKTTRLTW